MRWSHVLFGLIVGAMLGCGSEAKETFQYVGARVGSAPQTEVADGAKQQVKAEQPAARKPDPDKAKDKGKPEEPVQRKIVYTAAVELVVEDLDQSEEKLRELVAKELGYVAKSDSSGTPGTQRRGSWTIRVPVEQFEEFMNAVCKLGELRRRNTDSQDITDQYYDLKAHIRTSKAEEETLLNLLKEKTTLEQLLAVRRELHAIRSDIEQSEGRIQRWDKETAYSTVTVVLHDRKDYVPPTVPDFGTSVGRTFKGSVEALLAFGKMLVLTVVALVPWLLASGVVTAPLWWKIYRYRKAQRATPPAPPAAPPPAEVTPA